MQAPVDNSTSSDAEILMLDVVNFFADSWKKLAIASIVGAALGLSGWLVLSQYEAKITLANANANADSITSASLKALQQTLPNLAAQIAEKNKAPQGQEVLFKVMSATSWWSENLTPIFNFSKADIRDLGPAFKSDSNPILFLIIKTNAGTRGDAIERAKAASQFLRSGAIYLEIEAMLKSQEIDLLSTRTEIDKKYNNTKIELEYLIERLNKLEDLAKRFPIEIRSNAPSSDTNAKTVRYMPLSTQIVAINGEIDANREMLKRIEDKKLYLSAVERWLSKAQSLFIDSFSGIDLNGELLKLEHVQREQVGPNNPKELLFFDELRARLLANEATYLLGLKESPVISVARRSMIKSIVWGLAATLFLTFLILLSQRMWLNVKGGGVK